MVIVTYELNLDHESEAQSPGLVNSVLNHERRAYDTPQWRGAMEAQSPGLVNSVLNHERRAYDTPHWRGAMEAQSPCLVNYVLNHERRPYDTPQRRGAMFDYVLAADGLYLHAKREELEICLQVAPAEVRGLDNCFEKFAFGLPKVPSNLVKEILYISTSYAQDSKERLFWLEHSPHNPYDDGWSICHPLQMSSAASCRPIKGQDEAYRRALIVIHSHHSMPARFSGMDDRDETGFRLYGVIGKLTKKSEIRLRVGCHGYSWEIPASWALELPAGLRDCYDDK